MCFNVRKKTLPAFFFLFKKSDVKIKIKSFASDEKQIMSGPKNSITSLSIMIFKVNSREERCVGGRWLTADAKLRVCVRVLGRRRRNKRK